jgi:hypothetical protein
VREERIFRKLGYYAIAPHVEKSFKILKDWPIALDDEIIGKERADQKRAYDERVLEYLKQKREQKALQKLNGNSHT